jgi:putative transposase
MRKRYTDEQIIGILREADAGRQVSEIARAHGIATTTFYRWKAKFGEMVIDEAKRLRQLEDENRRLKHVVADLTLDNQALKGLLAKKW